MIEQQAASVREQFLRDRTQRMDYVVSVQPVRQNERLAIQKGLFLFPCEVEKIFESNLCRDASLLIHRTQLAKRNTDKTREIDLEMSLRAKVIKIDCPRSWHAKAYLDLYSMNLDAAASPLSEDVWTASGEAVHIICGAWKTSGTMNNPNRALHRTCRAVDSSQFLHGLRSR